jgi:hypothetical protein
MKILLSLDLSSTCTGWAKFDIESKKLLSYGSIYPSFKNPVTKKIPKYSYPQLQVLKLRVLSDQIIEIVDINTSVIVIEEINRGKNRLGQKVLDGLHFVLLERMPWDYVQRVFYYDSDGRDGWRSVNGLALQLSEFDKLSNKNAKKINKKLGKGEKKTPVITQKTLAIRYVNKRYQLNLTEAEDSDAADAIGLGTFVLDKVMCHYD